MDNDIEKSHWIKVLSERMGVDESALTNMLKKISLKSKIEDQPEDSQRRSLSPRTKSEVLLEELIGLMLVSSQVWEEAVKKAGSGAVFPEDSLLNLMLEKGERLKYNFDDLIKFFGNDRPSIDRAEKIYFEKRYRLDLNNNLEEIDFGDGLKQLDICLNEILKDEKRMALAHIAADLKIAENRKDQNAIIFLREEFNKISGELARLIK